MEFTKEQNLPLPISSLNKSLEETTHGSSNVDDDVAATKTEQKRKRQDIDFFNNMSDQEYIQQLEMEVTRLATKIDWLKPNHVRRMRIFCSIERSWLMEKMKPQNHAESSSSLPKTEGDSKPSLPKDLATQHPVMHAKAQAPIKTKEPVQSTKEGKKRKWQYIEDLKEKGGVDYIPNLEVVAEDLSRQYLKFRDELFNAEMGMIAEYIKRLTRKMASRRRQHALLHEEDDDDDDLFEDLFQEEDSDDDGDIEVAK